MAFYCISILGIYRNRRLLLSSTSVNNNNNNNNNNNANVNVNVNTVTSTSVYTYANVVCTYNGASYTLAQVREQYSVPSSICMEEQ